MTEAFFAFEAQNLTISLLSRTGNLKRVCKNNRHAHQVAWEAVEPFDAIHSNRSNYATDTRKGWNLPWPAIYLVKFPRLLFKICGFALINHKM